MRFQFRKQIGIISALNRDPTHLAARNNCTAVSSRRLIGREACRRGHCPIVYSRFGVSVGGILSRKRSAWVVVVRTRIMPFARHEMWSPIIYPANLECDFWTFANALWTQACCRLIRQGFPNVHTTVAAGIAGKPRLSRAFANKSINPLEPSRTSVGPDEFAIAPSQKQLTTFANADSEKTMGSFGCFGPTR
jgi:hypothetical protein